MKKWHYTIALLFITNLVYTQKGEIPEKGQVFMWYAMVTTADSNIIPGNVNPSFYACGPNQASSISFYDLSGNYQREDKRKQSIDTFYVKPGGEVQIKYRVVNELTSYYEFDQQPFEFNSGIEVPTYENYDCYGNSHGGKNCAFNGSYVLQGESEIQFFNFNTSGISNHKAPYKIVFITEQKGDEPLPIPTNDDAEEKKLELTDLGITLNAEEGETTEVYVFDPAGNLIQESAFETRMLLQDLNVQTGVYFLIMNNPSGSKTFKIHLN